MGCKPSSLKKMEGECTWGIHVAPDHCAVKCRREVVHILHFLRWGVKVQRSEENGRRVHLGKPLARIHAALDHRTVKRY